MPKEFQPSVSIKGLNTDFKIDSLEEGEYPYALNAVSRDNLQFLTNDLSNDFCVQLSGNVIGHVYIDYHTFIIFLDINQIWKVNVDTCTHEVLLDLPCLNFNVNNQIRVAYTALNDCNQKILYWTDGVNPIRYYNIDTDETITDCGQLSLMNCNIIPNFNSVEVLNSGGNIRTGVVQFAISLGVTKDNNSPLYTNWNLITNPISIYDDNTTDVFWRIDGAPAGTITNKSIKLVISNLASKYNLLRIAVLETVGGVLTTKLVSTLNINEEIITYVYNGSNEQDIVIPLAEIVTNKASYIKARDLLIKDNRLIIANLTTIKNINYQKYANNIDVEYFTEKIRLDIYPYAYKNPRYTYSHKSWMRDEVYSLAIVWEFCDNSESVAFHIPGREMQCFDYRIDIDNTGLYPVGVQVTADLEGNPLCDDFVFEEEDANIIDCDLVKWKNRNTSVRTYYTDCSAEDTEYNILYPNANGNFYVYTVLSVDLSSYNGVIVETTSSYNKWEIIFIGLSLPEATELLGQLFELLPTLPLPDDCAPSFREECVYTKGKLGYHQSCERYPLIKDCDGEYMYPTELDEFNEIRGQFIRHHRIPDSTTEPHYTTSNNAYVEPKETENIATAGTPYMDTYVYPIGLNYTNIQPPDDIAPEMIKGFRIVYIKRTETNKSVVAKGTLHGCFMDDDKNSALYAIPKHAINSVEFYAYPGGGGGHLEPFYSVSGNVRVIGAYTFISPNTSFINPELVGDYIKIEWEYFGRGDVYGDRDNWDNDDFCDGDNWGRRQNININQKIISTRPTPETNVFQINRKLRGLMYAPGNTFVENIPTMTFPLDNRHRESSVYLELESDRLDEHLQLINYENQIETDFYNAPPYDTYPLAGVIIRDSDDSFWKEEFQEGLPSPVGNPIREALNTMGSSATHYVAIKRQICDQYGRVETSIYSDTGLRKSINNIDPNELYSIKGIYGDSFINYWSYRRTSRLSVPDEDGDNNEGYEFEEFKPKTLKTLVHCVVESDINVDLRHEGEVLKDTYYPKLRNKTFALDSAVPNSAKPLNSYLNRFYYNTCNKEVEDWVDNYFAYNIDYSLTNDIKKYLPVTITYKTCDCVNELQSTIAYSNKSNLNNFNYNDFLESNFLTVPSMLGPINNIFVLNNTLFAHTRDIIWKIFSNDKQLKVADSTVYLGQGDLFNKDPQAVYATNSGYAGNMFLHGTILTENGYYFYDKHAGKIHHFTDKLDDLSLKKMSNFFKNNSDFCIDNVITNVDNFANPNGLGVMFAYDYYNNRLLITKKNYEFVDINQYGGIYNENDCIVGQIYYHNGYFVLVEDIDCSYSILSLENSDYFCDKSFTMSYSYNTDSWLSFHSFVPDYYLFDRNNFYTVKNKAIYKHNIQCNYLTYYDTIYPYILDFPIISKPDIIVDTYNALHWNSFAYQTDAYCNETFKNEITFNKLLIYNSMQSTGYMNLIYDKGGWLRKEPTYPNIHVDRNERHFSINNLRDYVTNYDSPMFINNCDSLCSRDVNKLFNNAKVDINKHYKQLQRLRDSYAIARFMLENTNNIKLVMDYLITTTTKSSR